MADEDGRGGGWQYWMLDAGVWHREEDGGGGGVFLCDVFVCFVLPPVKGELLLNMRYQSLVLTSMMSPPYPRAQ